MRPGSSAVRSQSSHLKMTRHGKNCTASAVYSYHEKKRDTKASGYGSQAERLSKDAVKGFDCCGLTLQPCREPVITSEGHLYDKEAILEYIVHQKQDYAKKLQAYEKEVYHQIGSYLRPLFSKLFAVTW